VLLKGLAQLLDRVGEALERGVHQLLAQIHQILPDHRVDDPRDEVVDQDELGPDRVQLRLELLVLDALAEVVVPGVVDEVLVPEAVRGDPEILCQPAVLLDGDVEVLPEGSLLSLRAVRELLLAVLIAGAASQHRVELSRELPQAAGRRIDGDVAQPDVRVVPQRQAHGVEETQLPSLRPEHERPVGGLFRGQLHSGLLLGLFDGGLGGRAHGRQRQRPEHEN